MDILWTEFAEWNLKEIFLYHNRVANKKIAEEIKERILLTTNQLKNHPFSGQIEENLIELKQEHRYLICKNYKIIYRKLKEGILITDIFDTRLNPIKMKNPDLLR